MTSSLRTSLTVIAAVFAFATGCTHAGPVRSPEQVLEATPTPDPPNVGALTTERQFRVGLGPGTLSLGVDF